MSAVDAARAEYLYLGYTAQYHPRGCAWCARRGGPADNHWWTKVEAASVALDNAMALLHEYDIERQRLTSPAIPGPHDGHRPDRAAQTKGGDRNATAPGKPGDSDERAATVQTIPDGRGRSHVGLGSQAARPLAPSTDAAHDTSQPRG
jgi:hypothetical protein